MQNDLMSRSVHDPRRLASLDALAIVGTPPEQSFDDIARLATRLCATPVALVSLVAADRQWFKARVGFPQCATDLNASVCVHALAEPDIVVIPDLTADPRTAENPLVTHEPHIRFYAGAPLRMRDGQALGLLCVIDTVPRPDGLTLDQADDLRALTRQTVALLEARRALVSQKADASSEREHAAASVAQAAVSAAQNISLRANDQRSRLAQEAGGVGTFEFNSGSGMMQVSSEFCRVFGLPHAPIISAETVDALGVPEDVPAPFGTETRTVDDATSDVEYRIRRADDGEIRWIARRARSLHDEAALATSTFGTVRDVTDRRQVEEALRLSEERLNLAFEATGSLGWWDWDVPNDRIYANEHFARMYGVDPAAAAAGAPIADFVDGIHPDDRDRVAARIRTAIETAGEFAEEYRLLGADGTVTWVYARGRCYHDAHGRPQRYPGVTVDITAAKQASLRQAALIALGDRLRDLDDVPALVQAGAEILARTMGATRAGYGLVDATRETVDVPTDWCAPGSVSVAGLHSFRTFGSYIENLKRGEIVAVEDVTLDPRTRDTAEALLAIGVRVLLNVPILERGRLVGIGFVNYAQAHAFTDDERIFVRAVSDRVQIAVARVRAEEEQALLNQELSHRLKNTLSMVQGIASQTLRGVADRTAVEAFTQRVIALSHAHEVLLQDSWTAASIHVVLDRVLALHSPLNRLRIEGPKLELGPQATLSLSMLMHEMATNAVKYGALSTLDGTVQIGWGIAEGAEPTMVLTWQERGGPPAVAPKHTGFGSRIIRLGLIGTRDTDIRYTPLGLDAEFRAPLSQVQVS